MGILDRLLGRPDLAPLQKKEMHSMVGYFRVGTSNERKMSYDEIGI